MYILFGLRQVDTHNGVTANHIIGYIDVYITTQDLKSHVICMVSFTKPSYKCLTSKYPLPLDPCCKTYEIMTIKREVFFVLLLRNMTNV